MITYLNKRGIQWEDVINAQNQSNQSGMHTQEDCVISAGKHQRSRLERFYMMLIKE